MTDIYIVLLRDRHIDPKLYPYTTREAAVSTAEALLVEYAWVGAEIERGTWDEDDADGWIWSAQYSEEGDSITVMRCELNE
jgi:hypothetical protein